MKRVQFLKLLLSLPLGVSWLVKKLQTDNSAHYLLNKFFIAGFQYYEGPRLIEKIKPDESLHLAAEPGNPFDKFAVAIYRNGVMLGHVPRRENKHISRLLQQGLELQCNALEVNPDGDTWEMLKVEVLL